MSYDEQDWDQGGGLPDFVRDPIGMVRRRWKWMIAAGALGLLATVGFVAGMKPSYVGTATILVTSQQIPEAFVRPTVEEDSILRINALVGQVLTRANLSRIVMEQDLYPELRDSKTLEEIVELVRGNIAVNPQRSVSPRSKDETALMITVEYTAPNPVHAAAVANQLATLFTTENILKRSMQARRTTEFLRAELGEAEQALREQDARITEFKQQHRGELPSELDSNLGRLERLQQQRQSLAMQIAESTNRLTLLSSGQDPEQVSPDARLAALRAALGQSLAIHTERHPDVLALRRQIEALEQELASAPAQGTTQPGAGTQGALVATERVTMAQLRRQLRETEVEIAELDARVSRTPRREEELLALEQRAQVLRESYLDFLRKVQESELAESLESTQQGERFSIVDRAYPPSAPSRSRPKLLIAGLIASLGLGLGVGVLLEMVDPVFFAAEQIDRASAVRVLGTMPHIS